MKIELGAKTDTYMQRQADIRGLSVAQLCARILDTVARDDMALAVLDDLGRAPPVRRIAAPVVALRRAGRPIGPRQRPNVSRAERRRIILNKIADSETGDVLLSELSETDHDLQTWTIVLQSMVDAGELTRETTVVPRSGDRRRRVLYSLPSRETVQVSVDGHPEILALRDPAEIAEQIIPQFLKADA